MRNPFSPIFPFLPVPNPPQPVPYPVRTPYFVPGNTLVENAISGPFNAAWRASMAQRRVMFNDPRNTPSRSQFVQGYTLPYQVFAVGNTWQTPSGQQSVSKRAIQPSTKSRGPGLQTIPVVAPI